MFPLCFSAALLALTPAAMEPLASPQAKLQAKEGPADALMAQAQRLRYSQRWYEAAATYRKLLAEQPGSDKVPQARFFLATTLERDQRWDEAAAAYSEFLQHHPDQRMLGKEAKLSRITCWGIRQGQSPHAIPGLVAALEDPELEVRVSAALQLAKSGDKRAIPALQAGLNLQAFADRATMSLIALGVKPNPPTATAARFFVMRIKESGKKDEIVIRLAASLARAVGSYLTDEQMKQARKKGVDLENLSTQIANAPKGSVLFSVEDGKSTITVTVE